MRPGLQEIAWQIVSGFHQSLEKNTSIHSEKSNETSEAARLAALTYVLDTIKFDDHYSFSNLSFEAENAGISKSHVISLSEEVLESFGSFLPKNLTYPEIVTLLGMIHYMGCYFLPLLYKKGTSQKPLGAYYTPSLITDYIVSLTVTPRLDELAASAKTRGLSALEEMLSLRTLDPACGTGVFLVSAMEAFFRAMRIGIQNAQKNGISNYLLKTNGILDYKQIIRRNLFGVDIDSGALEVTDVSLRLLSQTNNATLNRSTLGASLKQGNSLISLKGIKGDSNHNRFFGDPSSRFPFEWNDEFGEILDNRGFDFIIMNPPYERLKPNLAEFLRERLLSGEREIHLRNFSNYKKRMQEDVFYFRKSGEYSLGNRYSIDIHRLFIERTLQLTGKGSRIGFIVPSTILGDLSSNKLRKSLLKENRLLSVDDFPETSRLFEGVTQSATIMVLERGGTTKSFLARFGLKSLNDVNESSQNRIRLDNIEKTVGSTLTIPQVNRVGLKLMSKLHQNPPVHSLGWVSVNRGELDLTSNRECITSEVADFRLIRGSNISRYVLNYGTGTRIEYVDIEKLRKQLGKSPRAKHIGNPRIAGQQISNRTQRWRLKFALIPANHVLANSCNYLTIQENNNEYLRLLLLGILNSELLNWRFSLTNANNHVSTRELTQLPIPNLITRQSQILSDMLVDQVGNLKEHDKLPWIEALVFALYQFSAKESRDVLKMRSTPEQDIDAIVDELGNVLDKIS